MHTKATGRRDRVQRFIGLLVLLIMLLVLPLSLTVTPNVAAVSENIVISQIYGGGGNSGAPYTHDYVELFNRGNVSIDISGWTIQYASATGINWDSTALSGVLQPGQYRLIQEGTGSSGTGVPLPTPDITGGIGLSATTGKVALVSTATLLNCGGAVNNCFPNAAIVDFVGYGTSANNYEGTVGPAPGNSTAILRGGNGCTDTDNNANDFAAASPNPRNSATTAAPCGGPINQPFNLNCGSTLVTNVGTEATRNISATDPDGKVISVAVSSVTPSVAPGNVSVSFTAATSVGGTLTGTVTANNAIPQGSYTISLTFTNADSPTPQTAICNIPLTVTTPSAYTPIYQIQGSTLLSSRVGQTVTTEGVVTGIKTRSGLGFFIQDPTGDNNPDTSDGIFVYTNTAPPASVIVNHRVRVSATVAEFQGDPTDQPVTELTNNSSIIDLGVVTAITPTRISLTATPGQFVRRPPLNNIYSTPAFDPAVDGLDFYESLEGMLVKVDNPTVVGQTTSFGEFWVLPDNGTGATGLSERKAIVISSGDFNPETLMIDDNAIAGSSPSVQVGDKINETIIGPLDYAFGSYRIQTLAPLTANTSGRPSNETLAAVSGSTRLRVASYNIENFNLAAGTRRDLVAQHIVTNLGAPDLLVLMEVQDDSGVTNNGIVTADANLTDLASRVSTAGGPTYSYVYVSPADGVDGGQPGGNIRQVFFYRTDRGLAFVSRSPGDATTDNGVNPDGSLVHSPGRISPNDAAFSDSRKPLAGEFTFNGRRLIVIGNHLNSRIGDDPLYGATQPPVLSSETKRNQQTTLIRNFVTSLLTADANALVIVAGDMNEFEFGNPLLILKNGPSGATVPPARQLSDVVDNISIATDRYTYVYQGNAQSIDHLLYSQDLAGRLVASNIVHFNADKLSSDATRASDHEAVVADFNITADCNPLVVTNDVSDNTNACGMLSGALVAAASAPKPVTITFAATISSITVNNPLPAVPAGGVTIDGGCTVGGQNRGSPGVRLVGAAAASAGDGLTLSGGATINGLQVVSFGGYALVLNGNSNTITCSWLGRYDTTDPYYQGGGIRIAAGSNNNIIGKADTASGNVISGNVGIPIYGYGMYVEGGTGNQLNNTYVGYANNGNTRLNNANGGIKIVAGQLILGKGNKVTQ